MRSFSKCVFGILLGVMWSMAGCGGGHDHKDHGHKDHGHKDETKHAGHSHDPKFGGVLVEIGDHAAHLELNVDAVQKKLLLYVWDGEVEKAVRIVQPSVLITIDGGDPLALAAVENENTGEKPGNSSTFACPIDQLAGKTSFNATIQSISIQGQTFKDIKIPYPVPANK